jgi:HAD superfamily phosphoserine phosphatase-like hydrolase
VLPIPQQEPGMTSKAEDKVKVAVFDLNGTFYNKSSKDEFYKFLLKKRPKRFTYYFEMMYYKFLQNINLMRQTEFKENFFNYLDDLPPAKVKEFATEFWAQEYPKAFNQEIKQQLDKLKEEGVKIYCLTGGLENYVNPLFENHYSIDGFAGTQVKYDGHTYKVQGKACKDEEKLKRLDKFLEGKPYTIVEAYSDSKENILDEAEKAFLVEDGKIKAYKK